MNNPTERRMNYLYRFIDESTAKGRTLKNITLSPSTPYRQDRISLRIEYHEGGLFPKDETMIFILKDSESVAKEAEKLQERLFHFGIPFFDFRSMHEALSEIENERIYSALIQMV